MEAVKDRADKIPSCKSPATSTLLDWLNGRDGIHWGKKEGGLAILGQDFTTSINFKKADRTCETREAAGLWGQLGPVL